MRAVPEGTGVPEAGGDQTNHSDHEAVHPGVQPLLF
jgi:hypothetical protein